MLVVAAGLVALALFLIQRKQAELATAPAYGEKPRPITVVEARKGDFAEQRDYLAVVEPGTRANITARVSATIEAVLIDEGQRVSKGQPLVRLDDREARQRLEAIEAQIAEAKAERAGTRARIEALTVSAEYWRKEAKRYTRLGKQGAVPESEAEKARQKASEVEGELEATQQQAEAITSRIARLKKEKASQQTRLSYYTIESPWEGVVTNRHVDTGDMATPSKVLCEIEPAADLKLVFDVPQNDRPAVREGLTVRFRVDGNTYQQPLDLLYPTMNDARMRRAEVPLQKASTDLTSGAYIPVSVELKQYDRATLLPRSCLINSPKSEAHVFVVTDDRLHAQAVTVLGHANGQVAVRGVKAGATVVRHTYLGWARLTAGEKVEPIR
jgi:RND family efflux transporter MFP subunit